MLYFYCVFKDESQKFNGIFDSIKRFGINRLDLLKTYLHKINYKLAYAFEFLGVFSDSLSDT